MRKIFLWLNILLTAAVFVGNYFYLTEGGLLLKGLCSGGFVLMGIEKTKKREWFPSPVR